MATNQLDRLKKRIENLELSLAEARAAEKMWQTRAYALRDIAQMVARQGYEVFEAAESFYKNANAKRAVLSNSCSVLQNQIHEDWK